MSVSRMLDVVPAIGRPWLFWTPKSLCIPTAFLVQLHVGVDVYDNLDGSQSQPVFCQAIAGGAVQCGTPSPGGVVFAEVAKRRRHRRLGRRVVDDV